MSSTKGTSTSAVITSIIFNGAVFLGLTTAFLLLRLQFKRIYQPKSLDLIIKINKDQKYLEPLPSGLLAWVVPLLSKPKSFIIQQAGLDGYFFLRYLLVFSCTAFASLLLIFPILIPINATGGNGKTGLDKISFSNIKERHRFYAHAIISLVFYSFVLYIIYRELTYYNYLRECILASPKYAYKLSSRVVLFQSVPDQYLNEKEFKKLFKGVKKIWEATADSELEKKVKLRQKLASNLEGTLNGILQKAMKVKSKAEKKGIVIEPVDELVAYIPQDKRPTVRKYKLFGEKRDKINCLKEELEKVNKEIAEMKSEGNNNKSTMNSIFVEFENQYFAQLAHQTIIHHKPFTLSEHYVGVESKDIVWINMRLFWYERLVRKYVAIAAIVALVIFWAVPVAFVGVISNVNYLTNKLHFLRFIYKLGDTLMGLITALLPTVLLSVLMALLPIFIRLMAKLSGAPTLQHIEYFTQQAYFAFQVIQVFLVTTISSSASSVVTQIINQPTSAMSLLSENLPSASNFYVSYIVLQSFSIAGALFLQITTLVLFYVLSFILDKTVRKKWNRYTSLGSSSWGTDFPPYTNLMVISLAYSIISPIVLLFTAVGFAILYVSYLYYLCYVSDNSSKDNRGIHYPRALFQTIVGIYIGQICLLGLFVVAKAWGPVIIVAIALGITAVVHINLNSAFDKLITALPIDAMKSLDGVSETPSFFQQLHLGGISDMTDNNDSSINKKILPRLSESTDYDTSKLTDKEALVRLSHDEYYNESTNLHDDEDKNFAKPTLAGIVEKYDTLANVPLLAEGSKDRSYEKRDNIVMRFFKPHIYLSYRYCKRTLPEIYNHVDINDLDEEANDKAYNYPAVYAPPPVVWIPRDKMGLSKSLIKDFEGVIEISDDGATFDEDDKIIFVGAPPEYEGREKVQLNKAFEIQMDEIK
ncbi:Rsn1 protein [Saccharomycopsis crataegensis]|uniref:Rsn1 protein n=1 Tax=Saccharomycopsis crataegensis TaxID=43959 RepID=A0AAV5QRJ0_9ASCO|nr:Rsn1 protein [Saccharomycopsis crataegensis]